MIWGEVTGSNNFILTIIPFIMHFAEIKNVKFTDGYDIGDDDGVVTVVVLIGNGSVGYCGICGGGFCCGSLVVVIMLVVVVVDVILVWVICWCWRMLYWWLWCWCLRW
jgi:hypothetical protein